MCDEREVACGGVGVDTMASNEHCGECGKACQSSEACAGGACTLPAGCANGAPKFGAAERRRADIAVCQTATMEKLAQAVAACASGWRVCTSPEFTERNDKFIPPDDVIQWTATLDDGDACRVVDTSAPGGRHGRHRRHDRVRLAHLVAAAPAQEQRRWPRSAMAVCLMRVA